MGVYKRDDVWYVRVKHGKRLIRKKIGPDKRAAEIAYNSLRKEIATAQAAGREWTGLQEVQKAKKPKTFGEAAQDYLDERANYKPSTISAYGSILSTHLLPAWGDWPLRDITDSQLKKYQVTLSGKVSASRVNTIMQLLRSIFDQAQREGAINRDPSRAVRRMPEPKVKIDPLSEEELALVLSMVDSHFQPLFQTLAFTGARPNEMQALRWGDIDWNSEKIRINKGRVRGKEGLPKTASSERDIPITPPVMAALEIQKSRKLRGKDNHVFLDKHGEPINKHLDRVWARALKAAGIRHRPSYQLRHTFATQCIIKGLPLPYVAKVLGHSTIDTLIRHYAGWVDNVTKEHDEILKQAFASKSPPKMPAISSV